MGSFFENNPLYHGIDKIYAFHTCRCIKTMVEALNENFVPATLFNLPVNIEDEVQADYLASEFRAFREDLEEFTKEKISDETIREKIKQYNKARHYIRIQKKRWSDSFNFTVSAYHTGIFLSGY